VPHGNTSRRPRRWQPDFPITIEIKVLRAIMAMRLPDSDAE
jgi:hypothetical protein